MRILHFADSHINAADHGNWSKLNADKRPERTVDFIKSIEKIRSAAINDNVDLVLFAGDAYDNENPDNWYRDRFQEEIGAIAAHDIPVVMIPGNHDRNRKDTHNSAVSSFLSMNVENVFVPHEPTLLTPDDLRCNAYVIAIPWKIYKNIQGKKNVSNDEIRKETAAEIDDFIKKAEQLMGSEKSPIILLSHGEVEGAAYNGNRIVDGFDGEMAFAMETVADPRLSYTAMGHLHKFQNLNKNAFPPVVYSGSTERVDMTEAKDDKGYVLADIDDTTLRASVNFVSIKPRQMFDIKVEPKVDEDINDAISAALPSDKKLKGAIVKVTVRCPLSRKDSIDREALADKLADAFQIVGACPNMDYVHEQRVRMYDNKVMQSKTEEEIVADFFKSKGKDEANILRLVALHKYFS